MKDVYFRMLVTLILDLLFEYLQIKLNPLILLYENQNKLFLIHILDIEYHLMVLLNMNLVVHKMQSNLKVSKVDVLIVFVHIDYSKRILNLSIDHINVNLQYEFVYVH